MLTTTVTFEGNLAADPELRFTPTGKQLAELRVLVNARHQNDAGEWEDAEPTRHRVTCFGTLAENVTESLRSARRSRRSGQPRAPYDPRPAPTRSRAGNGCSRLALWR